jgi:cysteine desulfurase
VVTYLPVDKYGIVSPEELKNAIRDDTALISIMFANNEIGTIQSVEEIGKIARENKIYFHTDAIQAIGHIAIDVNKMNIDLLSLSDHKFQGPKGYGVLYIKTGTKIETLIHGGNQDRKRRAGTENVPAIVGLGKAIELATGEIEESDKILFEMRESLIKGLIKIPKTHLNGHLTKRLANNINVTFEYIERESLLLMLNAKGIFASAETLITLLLTKPRMCL